MLNSSANYSFLSLIKQNSTKITNFATLYRIYWIIMKKTLLLLVITLHGLLSNAQDFEYKFNGHLDEEKSQLLIQEIEQLNYFGELKFKLKENAGILYFSIPESQQGESSSTYTTATIKSYLVNYGLMPLSCEERK